MKKNLKIVLVYVLIFIISFSFSYVIVNNVFCDEIWNYGFSYNISQGLVPYRDFNMIVTPLYQFIISIFIIIFGNHLWSMHIFNAMMMTFILFIMYKRIGKVRTLFMFFYIVYICYPGYNFFSVFLMVILLELCDRDFKNYDILIAFIVSLLFLTKQTIGICLFFPMIFYSKNKIKSFISFLIPIFILFIYLFLNNAFYNFMDYCFFGMFHFTNNNCCYMFLIQEVSVLLILFYLFIKSNFRDRKLFYVIMYQIIVFPIFDTIHFSCAFFIVIYYLFLNLKENRIISRIIYCGIFLLIIRTFFNLNFNVYGVKSSFLYGRNLSYNGENFEVSSKYIKELYDDYDYVYLFSNYTYLIKLNAGIRINKFDLINNGNMGYNGANKYIKEIDEMCGSDKKCIFVIDSFIVDNLGLSKKIKNIVLGQTNLDIINYVIDNYDKTNYGDYGFDIYININKLN